MAEEIINDDTLGGSDVAIDNPSDGDEIPAENSTPNINYNRIPMVTTLPDGVYEGSLTGIIFTYEGEIYKCMFGTISENVPTTIKIENGKAYRLDENGEIINPFKWVKRHNTTESTTTENSTPTE